MAATFSLEQMFETIEAETGCDCKAYPNITHDETIMIPADQLQVVIRLLREHFGIYHLSTITGQVRKSEAEGTSIELIYHFFQLDAPGQGRGISLLVRLPYDQPKIESIVSHLPGADFYEREVAEMYGVTFTGREETPRLLLPDEWEHGPPFISSEVSDE